MPAFDDHRDGEEDEAHAGEFYPGEGLTKQEDAQADGRDGFEGSEQGCLRAADTLYGLCREHQRDDRGEEAQAGTAEPHHRGGGHGEGDAAAYAYHVDEGTEEKYPEGSGEGGDAAQAALVEPHEVDGVGERGSHDAEEADEEAVREAIAPGVVILAQQGNTRGGEYQTTDDGPREVLAETDRHDEGHQDGVDEEQRRGNAHRHVVVTDKEEDGGGRHEQPHDKKLGQVGTTHLANLEGPLQAVTAPQEEQPHHGYGYEITEQQDRIGVHACCIERFGKDGVGAVGGSRQGGKKISLKFHDSLRSVG